MITKLDFDIKIPAKTMGNKDYYPLLLHSLDSGLACRQILNRRYNETVINISKEMNKSYEDVLNFLCFMVAIHDIGKFSIPFLLKIKNNTSLDVDGLIKKYFSFYSSLSGHASDDNYIKENPHNLLSILIIQSYFKERGFKRKHYKKFAYAVGGHHGSFFTENEVHKSESYFNEFMNLDTELYYKKNLFAHIDCVKSYFNVDLDIIEDFKTDDVFYYFTGINILSDWISSDICPRKYNGDIDFHVKESELLISKFLDGILFNSPSIKENKNFEDIFSFVPNKLQSFIIENEDMLNDSGLIFFEDLAGSGKTEAAFWLEKTLLENNNFSGSYMGMPTKDTSNQMMLRKQKFFNIISDEKSNLNLLHGDAKHAVESFVCKTDNIACKDWYLDFSKRGLLSTFGVGTIDRILQMALNIKHFPLQTFALMNRVIIVDEVHAYDEYMLGLLCDAISILSKSNCVFIIMSATLPSRMKKKISNSYLKGKDKEKDISIVNAKYPRISVLDQKKAELKSYHVGSKKTSKTKIDFISGERNFHLDKLYEKIDSSDGCAVWYFNTVSKAQEAYRYLENKNENVEMHIYHASNLPRYKTIKEKELVGKFGKNSSNRPKKSIVISTQILEMSLDIDFDIMYTEMCPIDALYQRLGRLWRHNNIRPNWISQRECFIYVEEERENSFKNGYDYLIYSQFLLNRTYNILKTKSHVNLPEDADLVEIVYDLSENKLEAHETNAYKSYMKKINEYNQRSYFNSNGDGTDVYSMLTNSKSNYMYDENFSDIDDIDDPDSKSTRLSRNSSQYLILFEGDCGSFFFDDERTKSITDKIKIPHEIKHSTMNKQSRKMIENLDLLIVPDEVEKSLKKYHYYKDKQNYPIIIFDKNNVCIVSGELELIFDKIVGLKIN